MINAPGSNTNFFSVPDTNNVSRPQENVNSGLNFQASDVTPASKVLPRHQTNIPRQSLGAGNVKVLPPTSEPQIKSRIVQLAEQFPSDGEFKTRYPKISKDVTTDFDVVRKIVQEDVAAHMLQASASSTDEKRKVLDERERAWGSGDVALASAVRDTVKNILAIERGRLDLGDAIRNCRVSQLGRLTDPDRDACRLLLDGSAQSGDFSTRFESEAGYMVGMMSAFEMMLGTLGKKLDCDGYESLQKKAVAGVKERKDNTRGLKPGFRDANGVCVGLNFLNMTPDGRHQYEECHGNDEGTSIRRAMCSTQEYLVCKELPRDRIQEICQNIFDCYYRKLEELRAVTADDSARREYDVLRLIADCCQSLDQYHLFADGNIRTSVFLVMNKLLLENGLRPVLPHDPNVMDMHSLSEIASHILDWQDNFDRLVNLGDAMSCTQATAYELKRYEAHLQPVVDQEGNV